MRPSKRSDSGRGRKCCNFRSLTMERRTAATIQHGAVLHFSIEAMLRQHMVKSHPLLNIETTWPSITFAILLQSCRADRSWPLCSYGSRHSPCLNTFVLPCFTYCNCMRCSILGCLSEHHSVILCIRNICITLQKRAI